jgi:hypothetical protein
MEQPVHSEPTNEARNARRLNMWPNRLEAAQPIKPPALGGCLTFYGGLGGKQRELVITGVTRTSLKGYLLPPEQRTNEASN